MAASDEGIKCYREHIDDVLHTGYLSKLGGAKDGMKGNWKRRFAVLKNDLYYYESEDKYLENQLDFKGRLKLNSHFVSALEGENENFEFTIHALPKSLTCRADSQAELDMWLEKLALHGREKALNTSV